MTGAPWDRMVGLNPRTYPFGNWKERDVMSALQDAMTAESAAVVKEAYLADREGMREKFLGLAEAIGSVAIA